MNTLNSTSVSVIFGKKILDASRNVMLDSNNALYVNVKGSMKSCTVRDGSTVFVDPNNFTELLKSDVRKATKADLGITDEATEPTEASEPAETEKPSKPSKPAKQPAVSQKSVDEAMAALTNQSNMALGSLKKARAAGDAKAEAAALKRIQTIADKFAQAMVA